MKAGPPRTVTIRGPSEHPSSVEPNNGFSFRHAILDSLPGLLLCLAIAAAAIRLADLPYVKNTLHLGALLLVILLGMVWKNVLPPPAWAQPGIEMAQRPILRWGVAFLGFKLSLAKLVSVGAPALAVVIISTLAALVFGFWFAKAMGLNDRFAALLGVGGAICGASAIVATETVVKAERKDVAASIGVITLFGTIGILLYPFLARAIGMQPFLYAVWTGASLHETAQVVAAAQALRVEDVATVVKLARIAMLAPVVFYFAWWMRKKGEDAEAKVSPVPWFLVLFVIFALANSYLPLPPEAVMWINNVGNVWLLCVGMAGVGLQTGFKDLKSAGMTAVWVGAAQWIFLSLVAFTLATVFCRPAQTVPTSANAIVERPR
ncbi:MAG: hypothetical protein QOJ65_537 [Fimbriimonadaceae bacterium]|nr:hypothetical protein [Fimbriimonadaceae bacterium]